jgi:hypothetical protein
VRRISTADIMGEAIIAPATGKSVPGRIANVFYDRVMHASTLWGLFSVEVLGDAIAHEMGHLLLGAGHSSQGIMKADWTSSDLRLASRGALRFSSEQVELLQSAAISLHRDSSPMILPER